MKANYRDTVLAYFTFTAKKYVRLDQSTIYYESVFWKFMAFRSSAKGNLQLPNHSCMETGYGHCVGYHLLSSIQNYSLYAAGSFMDDFH